MLGPASVDEFPSFRGWTPPALRSEIETFTDLDADFVLDGDGTGGHGYHRHGFAIKPDEFPPGWDEYDVVDLVNAIIDRPLDGAPGRRRDSFSLFGSYRGVIAVIRIRCEAVTGWRITTVHPYGQVRWMDECQRMGT